MADDYDKAMEALKEENKDIIEKDESFISKAKSAASGAAQRAGSAVKGVQEKFSQYKRGEQIKRQTAYEKKLPELERDVKVREQEAHLRALQTKKSNLDEQAKEAKRARFNRVFGGASPQRSPMGFSPSFGGGMNMPSVGGGKSPSMGGGRGPMMPSIGDGKAPSFGGGSIPSLFDKKPKPKKTGGRTIVIKLPRMK